MPTSIDDAIGSVLGGSPDDEDETTLAPRLKNSIRTTAGSNPDQEAKLQAAADFLHIPRETARAEPQAVQERAATAGRDLDALATERPRTASYLAKPDNAAKAHDDIGILARIEEGLSVFRAKYQAFEDKGVQAGKAGLFGSAAGGFGAAKGLLEFLDPQSETFGLNQATNYLGERAGYFDAKAKMTMPKADGLIESGVYSGLASVAQNAPVLVAAVATRQPAIAIDAMAATVGGQGYLDARAEGLPPFDAFVHGVKQGFVERVTEAIPVHKLIGDLKAGIGPLKTLGHQLITENVTEQVATAWQDLNDWADLPSNKDKTFQDYLAERPGAALQTAVATTVGVGINTGTAVAVDRTMKTLQKKGAQADEAVNAGQVLKGMVKTAAESKLRERDPAAFRKFVDDAARDGPVESVYVSAEDLQQSGVSLMELAQAMPSVNEQLLEALTTNGDIRIPVGELLADGMGEKSFAQSLVPHLRVDPAGMSQAQAEAFMQNGAEQLKADVEGVMTKAVEQQPFEASAEVVRSTIMDQLTTANRFTGDVNEAYADSLMAFYRTQATNQGITPEEVFANHPVQITAQSPVAAGQLDQPPSPEALAAGVPETWREVAPAPKAEGQALEQAAPRLRPAVKVNGKVYAAEGSHFDALSAAFWGGDGGTSATLDGSNRGFVNHKSQFLTRRRAMKYAVENDLLAERYKPYSNAPELIAEWLQPSEDLNQTDQPTQAYYEPGVVFRSAVFEAVAAGPTRAPAAQWLATLNNTPGVKKEELEWIGVPEFLALHDGPVLKNDLMAYIAQNGVRIEEVTLGEISDEEIDAEANRLREEYLDEQVAEEMDENPDADEDEVYARWDNAIGFNRFQDQATEMLEGGAGGTKFEDYKLPGGENYREVLLTIPGDKNPRLKRDFTASHWDDPNVIAHTRLTDRVDAQGRKVLFVEEVQSDWHQKGRDQGYAVTAAPETIAEKEAQVESAKAEYLRIGEEMMAALQPAMEARIAELEADPKRAGEAADMQRLMRQTYELTDRWPLAERIGRLQTAANDRYMWGDITPQLLEARQLAAQTSRAGLSLTEARAALDAVNGKGGIPDAPFKTSWPALTMRRILAMAIEGGYDRVAWTTGQQQTDRYDLAESIGGITAMRVQDDDAGSPLVEVSTDNYSATGALIEANNGNAHFTRAKLVELLGADLGGRVYDQAAAADYRVEQRFEGLDLQIGGEGMKAFYDRNLRNITNDLIKKLDGKVDYVPIENSTSPYRGRVAELEALRDEIKATGEGLRNEELADVEAAIAEAAPMQPGFDITDKMRASNDALTPRLFQTTGKAPRGTFNPANNLITLLNGANLSTFLHETGHFYAETLAQMATDPNASEQIKGDFAVAAGFMGFKGIAPDAWLSLPIDARREGHERFARGFEAYLMEGKSPSQGLNALFARLRSWMLAVYQSLTALNVELTDEVRGVFDRLLATQEEITQAEQARGYAPLFENAVQAGMTEDEWTEYQRLGAQATGDAQSALATRSLRDMQWLSNAKGRMLKQLQAQANDKRKAIKAEVTAEVMAENVNRARTFLKRGMLDGQEVEGPHKLSLPALREMYDAKPVSTLDAEGRMTPTAQAQYDALQKDRLRAGAELEKARAAGDEQRALMLVNAIQAAESEMLDISHGRTKAAPPARDYTALGYGRYGALAEEGLHPDQVAELLGYSSGDELVYDMLNAEQPAAKIAGLTDQRMLERYGDLVDQQAIDRAADAAIHNDARLRFVATEANALAKAAGSRKVLATAAREFAAGMVARTRIRDLRPSRYATAETRAAAASAKFAAAGQLVEAATEKRNQLINAYAAKAASDARDDVEKALRLFASYETPGARKNIDPDYRDQIDSLLERFDLRRSISLRAIDKRKSLADWVKRQEELGFTPVIPEDLLNEANRKSYKDMTVEELRGLVDSVKNIAHLGRLKKTLLTAKDRREFAVIVSDAAAVIRDNATRPARLAVEHNGWTDKLGTALSGFLAIHRKLSSLVRQMTGGLRDGGVLWETLIRPMNAAGDREAVMIEQSTITLHKIFGPIVKEGNTKRKLYVPEIGMSLSLEGRLMIALNWGNEQNRQRVLDGDKWKPEQVAAILKTLTPAHLKFVQDIWDHIDSYWPMIAAKERRVSGVVPEKVEASPVTITTADGSMVDLKGGYFPLKYDPFRVSKAGENELSDIISQQLKGSVTRATTRRGHTKARQETVSQPVLKEFDVIFGHIAQVTHDLAWHEYLIDATRLLRASEIDQAILEHYGPEVVKTMKAGLMDIAAGSVPAANWFQRSVNHVRTGATVAGLGLNLMTSLMQPLGLLGSAVRIGPKWVAAGAGTWLTKPFDAPKEVMAKSDFMRLRAKTQMREINEIRNQVSAKWGKLTAVQDSYFFLIGKMQLVADVPTWLGQYQKSVAAGRDEDTAVALADQAVLDSQGGGQMKDLAQIQRGDPMMKLWTNFYSYFNVAYNQLAESVAETKRVGPSRLPYLASDVLLLLILPSVLGTIIKTAVRGDDWDELPEKLIKDEIGYLFGLMVGLRDIGGLVGSDGRYSGPPGARLLADSGKLYQQVEQGEMDESFWKSANDVAGVIFHYPSGQVRRTALGIKAIVDGDTKNPAVLAFGPPPKS